MVVRRGRVRTLLVVMLVATPARAIMIRGHGSPDAECLVGVEVEGRRTGATFADVVRRGSRVVQQSCGRHCQFNLRLAQNLRGCAPGKLRELFVVGDTDGKIIDRPALGVASHGTASHFDSLTLNLGPKHGRASRRLTFLGVARDGRRDEDEVTLVCERSTASCCGDGVVDPGEECDDGNLDDDTTCDSNCTVPACGNGIEDPGEECDDGNPIDGDACDHNCTTPRCGNGVITAPEACEPGVAETTCDCQSYCDEKCQCAERHSCQCQGQGGPLPDNGRLTFRSTGFADMCGEVVPAEVSSTLTCGGLYFGGGSKGYVPDAVPLDPGLTVTMAETCSDTHVSLSAVGMPDGCTEKGCLLGKPVILQAGIDACLILSLTDNARGSVDCATGAVALDVSLLAEVYNGACPECGVHRSDCDMTGLALAASVGPVPVQLGTASRMSTADARGDFCGFCRASEDGAFAGEHEGEPTACFCASGLPGCHAADACPPGYLVCRQEQPGAFNESKAHDIRLVGLAPASLGPTPMPARMSALFCVPPVKQDQIDLFVSLPGPGVLTLAGDLRLDALPRRPQCP
jgi:cysteine-rich repeat protein